MIIWLDIETTGLEPETDAILELAAVATADDLTEVGTFEVVTNAARGYALGDLHRTVQEMHLANVLWVESLNAEHSVEAAGDAFKAWIISVGGAKAPLAGSGVHFDRAFIRRHMRAAHDVLHYRNIDVSTLYETAKRFWPAVADGGPRPDGRHRAMSDIRGSIATYRYYLREIVPFGTTARSSAEPAFADLDLPTWNHQRGAAASLAGAIREMRREGALSSELRVAGEGIVTGDPRDWPHGGCQ